MNGGATKQVQEKKICGYAMNGEKVFGNQAEKRCTYSKYCSLQSACGALCLSENIMVKIHPADEDKSHGRISAPNGKSVPSAQSGMASGQVRPHSPASYFTGILY